jgi:gamma-glutamylcyclotransferase (GGCT)/AIG2-like uncharacterized protein YtfP
MNRHVFTYGSLMFPQVWGQVVAGNYRSTPATARDHARFSIGGETYPGMVAQTGGTVKGVLYLDVGPEDVAALDRFEGEAYERRNIELVLPDGALVIGAGYLYVAAGLSAMPWDPQAFQLEHFLQTYCRERL